MTYPSDAEPRGRRPLAPPAIPLTLFAATLAFAAAIALTNADTVVAKAFAVALDAPATAAGDAGTRAPLVAGSEEYWLMRGRKDRRAGIEPATWSAPAMRFAVGDRITITSGGSERVLEVVEVADAADVTRIDTGAAGARQLLVTCRDATSGDGRLVRFLTDPGRPDGATPERTL
jgi:hypothetical protein